MVTIRVRNTHTGYIFRVAYPTLAECLAYLEARPYLTFVSVTTHPFARLVPSTVKGI